MSKKKNTTMQDLLGGDDELSINQLSRGDVVKGTVVKVGEREILVDVGAKAEGIIPQGEIKGANLKVGAQVFVYVLTPEDRRGQLLLSLDKAKSVRSWTNLEKMFHSGEVIEVKLTGHNKGGVVADIGGLAGFIPFSHLETSIDWSADAMQQSAALDQLEGQVRKVKLIELDREQNRIILSETEALLGEKLVKRQASLKQIKVGEVVVAEVVAVLPYGINVSIDGVEGLVPIEEVSWEEEMAGEVLAGYKIGDSVRAEVIDVDQEAGRVKLSMKRVAKDPWKDIADRYAVGSKLGAKVTKITSYGVFVEVEDGVEAMVGLSSIPQDKELKVADTIDLQIKSIDASARQLTLEYVGC